MSKAAAKPASQPETLLSPEEEARRNYWRPRWILLLISFLLYGNTISNGHAVDDAIVITENQYTKQGFAGIYDIFTHDAFTGFFGTEENLVEGGRYRPLSIAMFAAEYGIFGESPAINHFGNAILYALSGWLCFVFLQLLLPALKNEKQWWLSFPFLATLLFMAHPLHTEVVANVKGRDEIMALLFSLWASIQWLKYHADGKLWRVPVSGMLFFLGLLSKESAAPFLILIPASLLMFAEKRNISRMALMGIFWVVFFGVYMGMRQAFASKLGIGESTEILNDPFLHASYAERFGTIMKTVVFYLKLYFVPHPLSHDYFFNQIPIEGLGGVLPLLGLLISAGALGLMVWGVMKKQVWGYGLLFFALTFSIVSNLFVSVGVTMAERFLFIPSLGLVIATLSGLQLLLKRYGQDFTSSKVFLYGLGTVIVLFSIKTVTRNMDWESNETLFTRDVLVSSHSAKLQCAVGGTLLAKAETETNPNKRTDLLNKSIGYLDTALDIYPEYQIANMLCGDAWAVKAQYVENSEIFYRKALGYYDTCLRKHPNDGLALQHKAVTLGKLKDYRGAINTLRLYVNYTNDKAVAFPMMLDYFLDANQPDSALMFGLEALKLNPENGVVQGKVGMIYGKHFQQFGLAVQYLKKAVELTPDASNYENYGIAMSLNGNKTEAVKIMQEGIAKFPEYPGLQLNLGITYKDLGDTARANACFRTWQQMSAAPAPANTAVPAQPVAPSPVR